MSDNPLKRHFREVSNFVWLPSKGRWYSPTDVELTDENKLAVYPMTSTDSIMLNTPDAMLSGHALEKVIQNCCPGIKNIKKLLIPDLDVIFVAIKSATNNGKVEYERKCPKCNADNLYDISCEMLLNSMTFVDEDDLTIKFNDDLIIHVKPYDFEMRQIFIKREFEEEKTLRLLDAQNTEINELDKANILGESVERLSKITFTLVSRSIEKIIMIKEGLTVVDQNHINEWLVNISKEQSDMIVDSVNKLNAIGVSKVIPVMCTSCNHQWEDAITFDPTSFFGKRS